MVKSYEKTKNEEIVNVMYETELGITLTNLYVRHKKRIVPTKNLHMDPDKISSH